MTTLEKVTNENGTTAKLWKITTGERSWRLEVVRGSTRMLWTRVWNVTEDEQLRKISAELYVSDGFGDRKPEAKVSWGSYGAVSLEDARTFQDSINEAVEAAEEAQALIDAEYDAYDEENGNEK